jgi:hypothetical protein
MRHSATHQANPPRERPLPNMCCASYFDGVVSKGWLMVVKYCTAAMIATGAVMKI